jgi:hypothetical protein
MNATKRRELEQALAAAKAKAAEPWVFDLQAPQQVERRSASTITTWSLGRFQGFRICAQEIECSPQRWIALGVGQHRQPHVLGR